MATDPNPVPDPLFDPIAKMYERFHGEVTDRAFDGRPSGGNTMLAVAALLAEVALRYDDLDRRVRVLEGLLADPAKPLTGTPD